MSRPKVEKQAQKGLFLVVFWRFWAHFERVLKAGTRGIGVILTSELHAIVRMRFVGDSSFSGGMGVYSVMRGKLSHENTLALFSTTFALGCFRMPSAIDWNFFAAVATIISLPIAVWALLVSKRSIRKSCVRLQIGNLSHRWDGVTLVYGIAEDQVLVASLPLVLKNLSKDVAAEDVTLEVVIPEGANLLHRSDNAVGSAELYKGIMPGIEFRTAVVGNFVHVYCLFPTMNPGTNLAFVFPFCCPETEITREVDAQFQDGKKVTLKYRASIEMLFNTIVHTRDSPPSVTKFGVRGFIGGNVETLIKIGRAKNLFGNDIGQMRLRDRLLLRNRRVVFVMPASVPWSQDGIQLFAEIGGKRVPVYRENHEDSQRWLFTGYAGFSRLRQTRWRFR